MDCPAPPYVARSQGPQEGAENSTLPKTVTDTEEEDGRQPDIDVTKRTATTTENGGGRGARTLRTQVERRRLRTACTGTRDTQCVYVPYVLSVSLE